jgi:hypothetical protein
LSRKIFTKKNRFFFKKVLALSVPIGYIYNMKNEKKIEKIKGWFFRQYSISNVVWGGDIIHVIKLTIKHGQPHVNMVEDNHHPTDCGVPRATAAKLLRAMRGIVKNTNKRPR